ncbi:MAG: hypothetical protein K2X63_05515, partial [Burkholderiaceae bacterium]|nr:hypothetical protein [Burkholderiaceae bacterium]
MLSALPRFSQFKATLKLAMQAKQVKYTKHLILLGLLGITSNSGFAHDEAYLDSQKSAHGGQVRMAGIYHFELVLVKNSPEAKENPVEVYVTDHAGNKISTAGASGNLTLLSGKVKSSAILSADGDNHFKTSAKYASSADLKAVLAITMAGAKVEQARFTPFASKEGATEHKH